MFESLLTDNRKRDRQFTVYRSGKETDVEAQFTTHAVDVVHRELPPGGPDPFIVIEEDGEFAGAIALEELAWLLEPPVVRPGDREDVSPGYSVLFDVLDETVFTAMERRQLLAVSREIEDRGYRVGTGTLGVSFQTLSTFESQAAVYRRLAAETDLDIHIYGVDDWTPPQIAGITYHGVVADTLGRYWVLAFDGGNDEMQACGLVAQERAEGYDGVWTDDPGLVADVLRELEASQ